MHANSAIRASIKRLADILSCPNTHERMLIGQVCFVTGWSLMWASALALAGLGPVLLGIFILLGGLALALQAQE
jgi:hypothetical protein